MRIRPSDLTILFGGCIGAKAWEELGNRAKMGNDESTIMPVKPMEKLSQHADEDRETADDRFMATQEFDDETTG